MEEPSAGKGRGIEKEAPDLLTEIPIPGEDEEVVTKQHFDGRQIHRVPRHLFRKKEQIDELYTPKMVSFGPYHHGSPHLCATEAFKPKIVTMCVSESGQTRQVFYNKIFNVIDQIRNCYFEYIKYDDDGLAEMMLRDACFVIFIIRVLLTRSNQGSQALFREQFGSTLVFACTDMFLLENQIPLWVVKLVIDLTYTNKEEEGSKLLYNYICAMRFGHGCRQPPPGTPREFRTQPFHFLDAFHFLCTQKEEEEEEEEEEDSIQLQKKTQFMLLPSLSWSRRNPQKTGQGNVRAHVIEFEQLILSATELKAKGISFKPSSHCLKDIKFKSSIWSAELQLPFCNIDEFSKSFWSNQIAYEASPSIQVELTTINYIIFLKSLVMKPQDADELREKKILMSNHSSEQVVEVIQDIEMRGSFTYMFDEVKTKINRHCNSKRRTWTAELIHTYFSNPWSVIALLAATFLLFLSILQTYYSIYPKNSPDNHASPRAPSAT